MSRQSYNKCFILGTVGKDPELRTTPKGKSVCSLSVATNDGPEGKTTNWHKVIVWDKQGESCKEYLKKGSEVFIEGSVGYRSYEDKKGNKVYITEILASKVVFLSSPAKSETAPKNTHQEEVDDDPPF